MAVVGMVVGSLGPQALRNRHGTHHHIVGVPRLSGPPAVAPRRAVATPAASRLYWGAAAIISSFASRPGHRADLRLSVRVVRPRQRRAAEALTRCRRVPVVRRGGVRQAGHRGRAFSSRALGWYATDFKGNGAKKPDTGDGAKTDDAKTTARRPAMQDRRCQDGRRQDRGRPKRQQRPNPASRRTRCRATRRDSQRVGGDRLPARRPERVPRIGIARVRKHADHRPAGRGCRWPVTIWVLLWVLGLMDGMFSWMLSCDAGGAARGACASAAETLRGVPGLGVMVLLVVPVADRRVRGQHVRPVVRCASGTGCLHKIPIVKVDLQLGQAGLRHAVLEQRQRLPRGRAGAVPARRLVDDRLRHRQRRRRGGAATCAATTSALYVPTTPEPDLGLLPDDAARRRHRRWR